MAKKVLKIVGKGNRKKLVHINKNEVMADKIAHLDNGFDTQHLLISALLPPAVKMFYQELDKEVQALCGDRYRHTEGDNTRWGNQPGSIIIGNQHVAVNRPRVRNSATKKEVPLPLYEQFQSSKIFEQAVFNEGLKKVSQRDYAKGLSTIANSFGFQKSSISRKWIAATAGKVEELQRRQLTELDARIIFIDGKRFHKHGVIVALGVGANGNKHILGIYESSTENNQACLNLLNDLESRGLANEGLIFIVDGGSGLNKALEIKYEVQNPKTRRAIRIRCHVHKWWNLEKVLGESSHKAKGLFWSLRDASNMAEAKKISAQLESVLKEHNLSALNSYIEAKNDLLALHELKLSRSLKRFLSTTNPIESLNSLIGEDMRRVKNWKGSSFFQRWLATYCLYSEKKMNRISDARLLPGLWVELRNIVIQKEIDSNLSLEQIA